MEDHHHTHTTLRNENTCKFVSLDEPKNTQSAPCVVLLNHCSPDAINLQDNTIPLHAGEGRYFTHSNGEQLITM